MPGSRSRSRSPVIYRRDRVRREIRSRSPRERDRFVPGDRDRERDKDRRRDRHRNSRSRSRTPPRKRRSRSRSPRRRRSRSLSHDRSRSKDKTKESKSTKSQLQERPQITDADLEGKTEDEIEMMKLMGFAGFDTTKGKHVVGNTLSAVNTIHKRKYRQYMNRKGGFNRPLDFVA